MKPNKSQKKAKKMTKQAQQRRRTADYIKATIAENAQWFNKADQLADVVRHLDKCGLTVLKTEFSQPYLEVEVKGTDYAVSFAKSRSEDPLWGRKRTEKGSFEMYRFMFNQNVVVRFDRPIFTAI